MGAATSSLVLLGLEARTPPGTLAGMVAVATLHTLRTPLLTESTGTET